jgi:hypothetical protein
MSYDLLLGKTSLDWSRGAERSAVVQAFKAAAAPLFTAIEKAKVKKLMRIKAKADAGDKTAQVKWKKMETKVLAEAAKGNKKAIAMAYQMLGKGKRGTPTLLKGEFSSTEVHLETLRSIYWKAPLPIILDEKSLKTLLPSLKKPEKEFLDWGLANGKVKMANKGRRVFFVTESPSPGVKIYRKVVGTEPPSASSGSFVGNDRLTEIISSGDNKLTEIITSGDDGLTEIITSGAFVGDDERAVAEDGGACERAALRRRSGLRN